MSPHPLRCGLRLVPAALLLVAGGCATSECLDNQNSLPLAGFYSSTPASTGNTAISLSGITVRGMNAPGDSVLVSNANELGKVYLPFRLDREQTSYIFEYPEGLATPAEPGKVAADTVTFRYKLQPWFVSAACGAVYYYDMTGIETTHTLIDSVACPAGIITNADSENLQIFFRANIEEDEE